MQVCPILLQDHYVFYAQLFTVYSSDSKLTRLLRNELGGNSKSRAILCLKPVTHSQTLTSILNFATRITQVKNFPVVNDSYAQVGRS